MTLSVEAGPYFVAKFASAVDQGALDLTAALADYELKASVAADAKTAISAKTEVAALSTTAPVMTYTLGSAPTAGTTATIANSASPTVVELLQYCKNLQGQINAIAAALKA